MSEPSKEPPGRGLKGALAGLGLCGAGAVVAMLAFPIEPPRPPQVASAPAEVSFDPPEVLDRTDDLQAPGPDRAVVEPGLDLTPPDPAPDRDRPQTAADAADIPAEPAVPAPSVAMPPEGSVPMIAPEADTETTVAQPDPAATGETAVAEAPDVEVGDPAIVATPPDPAEATLPPAPVPSTAAVAMIDTVAQPEPEAPDQGTPPQVAAVMDDATVALVDTAPTGAEAEPAPDQPLAEAAPDLSMIAPAPIAAAPEPAPDDTLRLAAAIPAPAAANPVERRVEDLEPDAQQAQTPAPQAGAAFIDYANTTFAEQPNKPFLAIIIEATQEVAPATLAQIAAPLTVALTGDAGAGPIYRAAGFELVASLSDVDTSSEAALLPQVAALRSQVGQAVAFADTPDSDLFRNQRLLSALAGDLAATGHGLVIFERFGAGQAVGTLAEVGVPHATILRRIDDDRSALAIRRGLDRAALEASKTGAAIVYARAYPETVAALVPWLLSNTARSIQIAPLTATIRRAGGT